MLIPLLLQAVIPELCFFTAVRLPDTSLHRDITYTGLVHRALRLFTPQVLLILFVIVLSVIPSLSYLSRSW